MGTSERECAIYRRTVYNINTLTWVLKASIWLRKINVTVFFKSIFLENKELILSAEFMSLTIQHCWTHGYNEDWKELR